MEKNEILEKLQDLARQNANLESWLQGNNQKRLAEYLSVTRLINFKVQEIVRTTSAQDLDTALYGLSADLLSGMDFALKNQLTSLHELYGVALDSLNKLISIVTP